MTLSTIALEALVEAVTMAAFLLLPLLITLSATGKRVSRKVYRALRKRGF